MRRYPILRLIVLAFRVLALLFLLGAVFLFPVLFVALSDASRRGWVVPQIEAITLGVVCSGAVGGLLVGFMLLAGAELIMVFIDIEANTRAIRGAVRRQSQSENPPDWARDPHGVWRENRR
jgi:hypothetical protein